MPFLLILTNGTEPCGSLCSALVSQFASRKPFVLPPSQVEPAASAKLDVLSFSGLNRERIPFMVRVEGVFTVAQGAGESREDPAPSVTLGRGFLVCAGVIQVRHTVHRRDKAQGTSALLRSWTVSSLTMQPQKDQPNKRRVIPQIAQ